MRFLLPALALTIAIAGSLRATDLPTVKAPLPAIATAQGSAIPSVDLRNYFEVTDIHGQVVQHRTSLGTFNLEMLPASAPATVTNFLTYVNGGRYASTFIHRSDQGLGIIQGGGYGITNPSPLTLARIATDAAIALEYNLPNTRGTIAMARTAAQNSATSEWFINTVDNTTTLGAGNGGGYAVFGRVTGTGMTVVDAIQALQVYAFNSPYGQLPLTGYSGSGNVVVANLIVVNAAEAIPIFPATAGQNAVVNFSVANTNPALVTPTVSGSALNLALVAGASGIADLTVTATDSNGNAVQNAFRLTVPGPEMAVEQPAGTDLADGGARTFPVVTEGSAADLVFTIKNTGSADLTLTGTPKITVDGTGAAFFTVTAQPASPVTASGGSATFTVRFAPIGSGAKSAALHIANNDTDENPFDINLTGTGNVKPKLFAPNGVIAQATSASGATVNFTVTALDMEDGALTPTVTPPSGSTFPLGDNVVNASVTDSNGAQTTATFSVRVTFLLPTETTVNVGARSGDPAPGAGTGALPAGTVLSTFGPPALSDFREMAARVTMLAGRKKLAGIYVENSLGERSLKAYQGGPAPGISTAEVTLKNFLDPVCASNGKLAFAGTVQGGGVKTTQDFGVWTDAFGTALELVLREGSPVPGLAGATLKAVPSLSLRDGELLALLKLNAARGVVTSANDTVLLRMTGANTATALLREGGQLEGSKIKSFSVLSPALGSPGHGRWHARAAVVAKVALLDGRTLLVKIAADGTVTLLLSTADAATVVDPQAKWKSFGLPAIGNAGPDFVVAATLQRGLGHVVAGTDTALLYRRDGGDWSVLVREGDPGPASLPDLRYASFFDPLINESGSISFLATLQGTGIKANNKTALLAGLPGDFRLIARLGNLAADADGRGVDAGPVLSKFISFAHGHLGTIFLAETSGGDTTAKNKRALWAVDSRGTLRRVLRTGDALTPGASPITGMTLLNAVPGAFGATRSFNATGSIALLATFADKTQALLRVDLP